MPTKRCAWGKCRSDSRYSHKSHMEGVNFFPFPKPWMNLDRCRSWLKACTRPNEQMNLHMKGHHHYVCSLVSHNKVLPKNNSAVLQKLFLFFDGLCIKICRTDFLLNIIYKSNKLSKVN